MRVGIEGQHIFDARVDGPISVLDEARARGLDGVSFKTVMDVSPTLDPVELQEARAHADELGMFLEAGVGLVNPYCLAEKPYIRAMGGGDTKRAFEMMIAAAASIGCTDLIAWTSQWRADLPGRFAYDRFRTDAPWTDQLEATTRFLESLAPALRDVGARVSIETHEEISSFEVARMVERLGTDVACVTLDTGNVLVRGEDPLAAARRLAPHVRLTHVKDAVMVTGENGMLRQLRACGEGVVDWSALLSIIGEHSPDVNLSIEDNHGIMTVEVEDPAWRAGHPDLTDEEIATVYGYARHSEQQIADGVWSDVATYEATPWEVDKERRLIASRDHLRSVIADLGF